MAYGTTDFGLIHRNGALVEIDPQSPVPSIWMDLGRMGSRWVSGSRMLDSAPKERLADQIRSTHRCTTRPVPATVLQGRRFEMPRQALPRSESTSDLPAPKGIRTPDLLIRRHGRVASLGMTRVQLSCRWRCREAPLSSSLSSDLSSSHGVKQRRSHRFLIPGDPALTIGCVKRGEAINVVASKTPFTQPIGKPDTAE
jgi:hypothetical protein